MNRGKTNNLDKIVEQINQKISFLLGKRDSQRPPVKKTSNLIFSMLILSFSLLLWIVTGFYYLGENQFGLILQNGNVTQVVKGIEVGLTRPYPFGDVVVIDASTSDFIDLNKMGLTSGNFTILSSDLAPIQVDAKFIYQVVDPALLFRNFLQKQNNLSNYIAWSLQAQLRNYFVSQDKDEILKTNLTVSANEIRAAMNQKLAALGVKVVKLNINSLTQINLAEDTQVITAENKNLVGDGELKQRSRVEADNDKQNMEPSIDQQLLQQAHQFKQDRISQTKIEIAQFNQLLAQYRLTPRPLVQQMYYDALAEIPTNQLATHYPLLDLNLSELITLSKTWNDQNVQSGDGRVVNNTITQGTVLNNSSVDTDNNHGNNDLDEHSVRSRHFRREVNRDRDSASLAEDVN